MPPKFQKRHEGSISLDELLQINTEDGKGALLLQLVILLILDANVSTKLLHRCLTLGHADAGVKQFVWTVLTPLNTSLTSQLCTHTHTSHICGTFCTQTLSLHLLYGSSFTVLLTRHFPIFPVPSLCVKCDTNLHADNDFLWDYTQLIDGYAVAPETTLGDVIWLSRYQTLKHIPVVNLPKWAFTEDIRHPRALTGNERQPFSSGTSECSSF